MIGSGIFIVPAEISRQVGSAGWLLMAWVVTGFLTIAAALAYGELASMMPQAGGQYVYLREAYSPLWGFLYGWTLFLVIQTGTIAAVAVAFSRFLGVLFPWISPTNWIVGPVNVSYTYAFSFSTQQLVAVAMLIALTISNSYGVRIGKWIQNVFTTAKTLSLALLILLGVTIGRNAEAIAANFGAAFWSPRNVVTIRPEIAGIPPMAATGGALALLVALCVAQVGSLFSSDAWNNITFTAGEVKEPKRNIPLSLAFGVGIVTVLYILANLAYTMILPIEAIQAAPDDRVATAALQTIFGPIGASLMAIAIVISTFGCNNGLILAGARVYYAMARDGLFFARAGVLSSRNVPAWALIAQGIWTAFLALTGTYGQLLDYVIFANLIFYAATTLALFRLRQTKPDMSRPYRAIGYPVLPGIYLVSAVALAITLLFAKPVYTFSGLALVLLGIPVYFLWRGSRAEQPRS
jgi:APA family basic amino acid/polyamine antiporter